MPLNPRTVEDYLATEFEGVDEKIVNIIKEILEQRDLLNRELEYKNQQLSNLEENINNHYLYPLLSPAGFRAELKKRQFYCLENKIPMVLFLIKMENYSRIRRENGIMGNESVLSSIASQLLEVSKDSDVLGYAFDYTFGLLIPFMTDEEAQIFSANLLSKVNKSEVRFKGQNIPIKIAVVSKPLNDEDILEFLYKTELFFNNRS